jgi:hypothetical protein
MINGWLYWIDHTAIGTTIRQSAWLFPFIETFHLFGIVSLVASTSILDLRLLGLGPMRHWPVSKLTQRLLPWAWWGFAVQLVSGLLMTSSEAVKNLQFLALPRHVLQARGAMGQRPTITPARPAGRYLFATSVVWHRGSRALHRLLLTRFCTNIVITNLERAMLLCVY